MLPPNCPDHGRLVLDLALGGLDDGESAAADAVRSSCPICRAWWREQLEGAAADLVDRELAGVFAELELPGRQRRHRWLAAAAAAVMTLGVGSLWLMQRSPAVDPVVPERTAAIQTMNFEDPSVVRQLSDAEIPNPASESVDVLDVEGAGRREVVAEEPAVAAAAASEKAIAPEPEPLFTGGFESGDLGAWVPST